MNGESVVDTAKAQLTEAVHEGFDWIEAVRSFVEKRGLDILAGLILLVVGIFIARKVRGLARMMMSKSKIDSSAVSFLAQVIYFSLVVLIVINSLGLMGFATSSMVAALGGFGIALGLALQGNLSNLASGILILIFKPFRVGEYIEGSGVAGTVEEIQIMSTILYTVDYKRVIIPNSKLTSENVINYSFSDHRRITFQFDIDYESDEKRAMAILAELFAEDEQIMKKPEPLIAVKGFVDQAVTIVAIPWVKNEDYWDVYYRVMGKVKERFDEAGIKRPRQRMAPFR